VRYRIYQEPTRDERVYEFIIDGFDLMRMQRPDGFDRALFAECEASGTPSDVLLALERMARLIEAGHQAASQVPD
jgi:hypothetical protein